MRLLLTGFKPFFPALDTMTPGIGNSSEKIVKFFAGTLQAPESLRSEIESVRPKVVVELLGVKVGSSEIPGTSANAYSQLLDKYVPSVTVSLGHFLPVANANARLDLIARQSSFKGGFLVKTSIFASEIAKDAERLGIYAHSPSIRETLFSPCNDVYWTALQWRGQRRAAFLHVPPYITAAMEERLLKQVLFVVAKALAA